MSQPPSNPYGSYPPPQQPGGYPAPQQPGGYPPPPQAGGYPEQSGGYPAPQPQYGGYPAEQPGGYPTSGQPYGGPVTPVGPPPKKSNVTRILLITLAVVVVLCLGGAAVLFFTAKDKVGEVVEASKTRVVAPATLAGRAKATDPTLLQGARQLETELKKSLPEATSTVGAFYGEPAKKDLVMIAAASGLNADPGKTLDDTVKGMKTTDVEVGEMKTVDAGPLGGEAKCGDAKAAEVPMGVCVWSDRGSVGMILIYFKTGAQAQTELAAMRGQIEQKG